MGAIPFLCTAVSSQQQRKPQFSYSKASFFSREFSLPEVLSDLLQSIVILLIRCAEKVSQ